MSGSLVMPHKSITRLKRELEEIEDCLHDVRNAVMVINGLVEVEASDKSKLKKSVKRLEKRIGKLTSAVQLLEPDLDEEE
jgi:cob(I)alamin adenosyltransferase